ncbi:MAG: aspartate 1-decarboxylase [Candidatus Ratteibacteria bacterium]|nr:aspartate 1-decarboxylase [Candidatus Ratteibacteria bacterium]
MLMSLLKTKIHGATVTETEPEYEGSITIDEEIMEKAGILASEELMILNANNGARFTTYCIKGKRNTGTICLNGPCARLAQVGDKVLILCFSSFSEEEAKKHTPRIVHLDVNNKITKITN